MNDDTSTAAVETMPTIAMALTHLLSMSRKAATHKKIYGTNVVITEALARKTNLLVNNSKVAVTTVQTNIASTGTCHRLSLPNIGIYFPAKLSITIDVPSRYAFNADSIEMKIGRAHV